MVSEIRNRLKSGIIDKGLEKLVSRKLLVWVFATCGVPLHFITGQEWMQISIVYIGTQAAMDFAVEYVKAKSSQT